MAEKSSGSDKRDKSAAEMRKINKPLMEKKRRERINNCLNQLKLFLMDATKKDSSYYSKLEKADILEMTVKYLKNLQHQHLAVAMATDPNVVSKYSAGYTQCASEVTRYLSKMEGFNPEVRNRLVNHLSNCVNKVVPAPSVIQGSSQGFPFAQGSFSLGQGVALAISSGQSAGMQPVELNFGQMSSASLSPVLHGASSGGYVLLNTSSTSHHHHQQSQQLQQPQQQPNVQSNFPVVPVQLIPAKLPSGDMVFLLANSQGGVSANNIVTPVPLSVQVPSSTFIPSLPVVTGSVSSSTNVPVSTSVAVVPPQIHIPKAVSPLKKEREALSPVKHPQPSTSGFGPHFSFSFVPRSLSDSSSPSGSGSEDLAKPHTLSSYEQSQRAICLKPSPKVALTPKDENDNVTDCDSQNNNNDQNVENNNVNHEQQQHENQQQVAFPVGANVASLGPMWRPW